MTELTLHTGSDLSRWRSLILRGLGLWPMAAGMGALTLVLIGTALPTEPVPAPFRLPLWLLAAGFVVTESAYIHIPVERNAHTISMSEIPLVLGLMFVAPAELVGARVLGAALALAIYRRQPLVKIGFNLALFALEAVTAVIVYHAVLGPSSPAAPRGWLAALAATGAAICVAASLVNVALALQARQRPLADSMRAAAIGFLMSVGVALLGTMCALLVWYDGRAAFMLTGGAAMLYLLMRVYGALSRRHDDLKAVYAFTSATGAAPALSDTIAVSLREAIRLLRAERAELVLSAADGAPSQRVALRIDGEPETRHIGASGLAELLAVAAAPTAERLIPDGRRVAAVAAFTVQTQRRNALVAPLAVNGIDGALVIAGRVGPDREFTAGDLDLADALAGHMALTLGRARMVERLRAEIRSKDQLIASVSHELRTPLTGILGYAELLAEQAPALDEAQLHEMVGTIAADALDMSHLVEDLLTAARMENDALWMDTQRVDLRAAARSAVDGLAGVVGTVEVDAAPAWAWADETRVRQILRNLLVNAHRYGGPRVRVETCQRPGGARLVVADDGAGIPPHLREVVFTPYGRAHEERTQPGSLGLGLSISRTLAHLMGGDLSYDHVDGWSRFELVLPGA